MAQGYEILQSSEGWDGINRARNEQPDLIVMDIGLPDISGLDAILLLKKDDQTKHIPIVAVTASVAPEDKASALETGCDAYIAKPVNIGNLLRTIELFLVRLAGPVFNKGGHIPVALTRPSPSGSALILFGSAIGASCPLPTVPARVG